MSSQEIVTLVVALAGFVSTLVGVALSNSHATKLEGLKMHEQKIRENQQHTRNTIEKSYQILITIGKLFDDYQYDVHNKHPSANDVVDKIKEIRKQIDDLKIAINLYLPSLKNPLKDYIECSQNYWNELGHFNQQAGNKQASLGELRKKLNEVENAYSQTHEKLLNELEILASQEKVPDKTTDRKFLLTLFKTR